MTDLGIAVLGVGVRGRHAWENLLATHPRATLRAICQHPDSVPQMLEERVGDYARRYALEHGAVFVDSFEELLERDDIHIISLMTEASLTAPYAIATAKAGKHIVCDKPMATRVADAQAMTDAAEEAGVETLVTYSVRFSPAIRHIIDRTLAGHIGAPLTVTFQYCPGNGPLVGYTASNEYRECSLGGELSNFGCYAIDVVSLIAGARVESVFALMGNHFYPDYVEAGMEDVAQVSLRFENGVIGMVLAGRLPGHQNALLNLEVTGESGEMRATDTSDTVLVSGCSGGKVSALTNPTTELAHDFVECILQNQPSPIPFSVGLENLRVLAAAYRSAETGTPVQIQHKHNFYADEKGLA